MISALQTWFTTEPGDKGRGSPNVLVFWDLAEATLQKHSGYHGNLPLFGCANLEFEVQAPQTWASLSQLTPAGHKGLESYLHGKRACIPPMSNRSPRFVVTECYMQNTTPEKEGGEFVLFVTGDDGKSYEARMLEFKMHQHKLRQRVWVKPAKIKRLRVLEGRTARQAKQKGDGFNTWRVESVVTPSSTKSGKHEVSLKGQAGTFAADIFEFEATSDEVKPPKRVWVKPSQVKCPSVLKGRTARQAKNAKDGFNTWQVESVVTPRTAKSRKHEVSLKGHPDKTYVAELFEFDATSDELK